MKCVEADIENGIPCKVCRPVTFPHSWLTPRAALSSWKPELRVRGESAWEKVESGQEE